MSRTIKRGTSVRRPVPRRRQPVKRVTLMQRLLAKVPVGEDTIRKAVTWTILGGAGAAALAVATWVGVPGMIGTAIAEQAGHAGFRVQQIEVTGLKRMDRMTVYAVALDQQSRAMPLVNLEDVRAKLLRYGWIKDAHVSRRLPDTLLVDIEERSPAAVWQDNGQLTLIDAGGVLLEPVRAEAMPDLPLIIGPGANLQEPAYQALLSAAPALKPRVKAATWIGNRRWDLTFDSGETLALPEEGAGAALMKFAAMDGSRPLLGRGWLRFDMRDPAKLVARRPGLNQNHALAEPAQAGGSATGATGPEGNATEASGTGESQG
ncbi:FtsQ-type POTRA domain-containing protein [Sphingomonas sp. CFBP8993]|uniref:cell division protein FtsQ/DivIB n=1 Tax=Sphingomonas sp. CFBP8993 TaxID=3096526 RepID=UPI002A6B1531|nr:cell division protein FtsQ/DivIB [Sphingomonas sp. CFBP8993]MDY0958323.1 FtsQ-type POTRA domain-containing protein [Sphingomonas sp. CFBP8993]